MPKEYKVMIVDDDFELCRFMSQFLSRQGFLTFTASDGEEGLKKTEEICPDLILLDAMMPQMSGYEVCKRLKDNEKTRLIPVIMITGAGEKEMKIKGIEAGVDDFITKPADHEELIARVRSLIRVKTLNDQLENVENVLYTLVNIIDAKDSYTRGHSERVTKFALVLAKEMSFSRENLNLLEKASKLHDIGKIGVPEAILNKPAALTEEEFNEIKKHPAIGEKICSPMKTLGPILKILRYHHERFDGKGYPDGMKGNDIPLEARIIAVVDSFDAMATDRPYRKKLEKERIIAIFKSGLGSQWDEKIANIFIKMLEDGKVEF